MAHKTTEKQIASCNAVNDVWLRLHQYLFDGRTQFGRHALVGIDHQNHLMAGVLLRLLALFAIALPRTGGKDFCAVLTGYLRRVIAAARIQHHDLIGPAY